MPKLIVLSNSIFKINNGFDYLNSDSKNNLVVIISALSTVRTLSTLVVKLIEISKVIQNSYTITPFYFLKKLKQVLFH